MSYLPEDVALPGPLPACLTYYQKDAGLRLPPKIAGGRLLSEDSRNEVASRRLKKLGFCQKIARESFLWLSENYLT